MLSWPAAVARFEPPAAGSDLRGRLVELIDERSRGEGRGLTERLPPATSRGFSWLVIPSYLASAFNLDRTATGRALVHDLGWLQYCIYGVFRVQDDLVDGDSNDSTLAVQTNHLLVEAARCASSHFSSDSPFWSVFQNGIDRTSRAVVALDRLQRAAERRSEDELELYTDLSACLQIAAAGTTFAAGRDSLWWDRLAPALDSFAVAAQIVDDLHDLSDDLAQGRINHAAWFLSRPIYGSTPEATEAIVASNLATTDRAERLLARAARRMDESLARLASPHCRSVHDYLFDYRTALDELAAQISARRDAVLEERPAS